MTFKRFHKRIAAKSATYGEAPVVMVAFGDSVTQGYTRAGTIEPRTVYHQQVKEKLETLYPLCTFSVINAGAAGQTATDALARLERDVIRYQPDLVIIGFGLNDAVAATGDGSDFKHSLTTLIERIKTETDADLILLTPNFMVSGDNSHIHPTERHYLAEFLEVYKAGRLAQVAKTIRDCALGQRLPLADVYAAWQALADEGTDPHALLANGLNHPNEAGHTLCAELIVDLIHSRGHTS